MLAQRHRGNEEVLFFLGDVDELPRGQLLCEFLLFCLCVGSLSISLTRKQMLLHV